MVKTGGKWEKNGLAKSRDDTRAKRRTQEDPPFARFSGQDFAQPFYSRPFFASRRPAPTLLLHSFYELDNKHGQKNKRKIAAMKSGSEARAKGGRATHPQISSRPFFSRPYFSRHDELSEIETACTLLVPSSCGLDNNMCVPVLISAFSWISSPLDHDTLLWDKNWSWAKCPFLCLRTRETSWRQKRNNVIWELLVNSKSAVNDCAYLSHSRSEHSATSHISYQLFQKNVMSLKSTYTHLRPWEIRTFG